MDRKYIKNGDAGSKGVRFQVSLLTLFLLKATRTLKNWRLSTENNEAGKFDDVVLECPDGDVLLQAKHRENKNKITFEDLLSANTKKDDFSLPKYFISYQEIKRRFKVKNVIICTNANFDKKTLTFLNSRSVPPESMLYYEADCLLYTFNDNILPDLKNNTKIYLQQCTKKKIDESVISDENVKDFLDHLKFCFNYPSGKDFENIIERQLSVMRGMNNFYEEASSIDLHSKIMDWFQQKDGEYLTEIHAKAMFLEIKRDKYWQKLEQYDVFFQNNNLFNFDSPTKIFHIVDDEGPLLQEIQVYRTLQDIKNVLCVPPESSVEELREILKAFELPKYTFITIIWSKAMEESLIQQVTSKLQQILINKDYKKVILVTRSNNARQFQLRNLRHEIINCSVIFDNFLEETKNNVLNKRIINFQGNTFSLQELFASETNKDYGVVLNSEILEKLIKDEGITVGRAVHPLDSDIECLYIRRTIIRNDEKIEEGDIFEANEKVVLIADGPGMGKTTVLTNLAISMKKKHPHLWIIKLILSDYTKYFKELKEGNKGTLNIVELLESQFETRLKYPLETFLFSTNNRVVLILDGVDEVSPNYTELVENLIFLCHKEQNFAKIVIASRPHVTTELENKLKVKLFKLKPFTRQNQVDFLTNYWAHNLGLYDTRMCEQYAEALLSQMWFLGEGYYFRESHFPSIPLQVRMLAEIFQERTRSDSFLDWKGCKEYLESNERAPSLPKINFAKLFKMFVDKKRSVYLEKLNPSGNAMADLPIQKQFDKCLKYHRVQALKVILDKRKCEFFADYKKNYSSVESEVFNIGIMQKTISGIHFIHRTFAEYFFAECLVRELQRQNQNVEFQKFLIDEVLRKHDYSVVRAFFDSFVEEVLDSLPSNIFKKYQYFTFKENAQLHFIHYLAENGHVAILQLILKSVDFKINKPTNFKECISYRERGRCDIFGKIKDFYRYRNALSILRSHVQQGGINIRNTDDETPLVRAIIGDHLDMVKFLIEQGSNINCDRSPGQAIGVPLYRAVERGYIDIVKFLVEQGANIKPNSEWDYVILFEAVSKDNADIAAYLLEKILEVDDSAIRDSFIPYTAAYLGKLDILEPLLGNVASVNDRITNGETLLFGAARGGQLNIVQYLVDHGADINSRDNKGNTVLHIVSKDILFRLTTTAKLLIELGVDINVVNFEKETALHIAAAEGNVFTVELLIDCGVNVNIENGDGRNAFHCAIQRGNLNVVKLLIQNGANIDMEVRSDFNTLDTAVANGSVTIIKYLLTARNSVDVNFKGHGGYRALCVAIKEGQPHMVKFLLDFGVDVNSKNSKEDPLLHSAVKRGRLDTITLLIKYGIDINVTDEQGRTALHVAADFIYRDTLIVKFLVRSGVDANIRDKYGCTALHTFLYGNARDCLRLVRELDVDTYYEGLEAMSEAIMIERWNANCYKLSNKQNLPEFAAYLSTLIFLIKHSADINLKDSHGNTAASLIIKGGGEGGKLLIKHLDLKLEKPKKFGNTSGIQ